MLRRVEACDAPEMWPPLPRERQTDGRPRVSREDMDQPWEDGEVEFKIHVRSDEDLSPACAHAEGSAQRTRSSSHERRGPGGLESPPPSAGSGAGGETQKRGGTRGSRGSGPRPPEGSDKGGSGEGTCTEKPSAGVSGRGLAAHDEGLGCPGDSGTWGALEWRLWLPQTPPHQAAGARHRASQGRPPFTPSPRPKEEPVTLRPVSGSVERHRCAGRLWADALRVSASSPPTRGPAPRPHGHPPQASAGAQSTLLLEMPAGAGRPRLPTDG